ncbi:hypothetical protein E2562_038698 [Oryza meyeriana var. granulata]|uniref:F-box domain-containing protein n=1 Tax=Oryza meyeriana var. granulata TaxID=110450 RepID=A0A6G1CZK4_9ORYZ|nr:hypothetical protein E2562_038698 [Oryza meyeriana var. granulata]
MSLGDMPESCIAAVLLYLDLPEICHVTHLNQAFRGIASTDWVWVAKLPANYVAYVNSDNNGDGDSAMEGNGSRSSFAVAMIKNKIYARMCLPTPFDGGTKCICVCPQIKLQEEIACRMEWSEQVTVLMARLPYANGVAISLDGKYVMVVLAQGLQD